MYIAKPTNFVPNDIGVIVFFSFTNSETGETISESHEFELEKANPIEIKKWSDERKEQLQTNYDYQQSLKAQLVEKAQELKDLLLDTEL